MEKELESRMGVLLKPDLTEHGHPSPFCQDRWDGRGLTGLKRTPRQDFDSFFIMFYWIKKIGDLFFLVIILDFRTACNERF